MEKYLQSMAEAPAFVPLQTTWSLHFDRYIGPGFTAEQYAAAIKEICVIGTVQSYWQWFDHLPKAGELNASCTYHLMKSGVRPLWEDKANEEGGSFTFKIPLEEVDHVWTYLTLNAIGGLLDNFLYDFDDEINGVSIGLRKSDAQICVWHASAGAFDMSRMVAYISNLMKHSVSCPSPEKSFFQWSFKVHKQLNNFGNDVKLPLKSKTPSPKKDKIVKGNRRPKCQSEPSMKKGGSRAAKRQLFSKTNMQHR